jgi:hypothetical protein
MTTPAGSTPWAECPSIEVDPSRPAADRFGDVPEPLREHAARLLGAVMKEVPAQARPLADAVRLRTAGRFHGEAKALAGLTDADWRTIILANISYDLAMSTFGCSTVALATSEGPVLARNMDWWPEELLARASCELRFMSGPDLAWVNLGWPGAIGSVTGMSGRGFAVALNATVGPEGVNRTGYPMLLHIRRVLEDAEGFDDAVRQLAEAKVAAPGLLTVVGETNDQRVVVERSPTRHAVRRPDGDEPLVTTNHYRLLFETETPGDSMLYQTTCTRFDSLAASLNEHDAGVPVDDTALLYALTEPSVMQEITAQHAIMRPRQRSARLLVPRRFVQ